MVLPPWMSQALGLVKYSSTHVMGGDCRQFEA